MKRKFLLFAAALLFACSAAACLSACDFISYIPTETESSAARREEFERQKAEYISLLRGLVSEDDFYEAELREYRLCLTEAVNRIGECDDADALPGLYESGREAILSVKTIDDYEAEAFASYRAEMLAEIETYADPADYRPEERITLLALIGEFRESISAAPDRDYAAVDALVRDFKTQVYFIPTDSDLYGEELEQLKSELMESLSGTYMLSLYRESEGAAVTELLDGFQAYLQTCASKEDALARYLLTENSLNAIKTAAALAEEERLALIEELYARLLEEIDRNIEEAERYSYRKRAEEVYRAMQDRVSPESIREEYRSLAVEISVDAIAAELAEYNDSVVYREQQLEEMERIKAEYAERFAEGLTLSEAKELFAEAKAKLDEVKTNDDLWEESVGQFRSELRTLYGDDVLAEPESLTEANSYRELADIIDYYAFYQKSGTEFVCDTFRVNLNFAHNNATWERNEVYWYCELLKSAVDIRAEFEPNSDELVVTLIPYDFAGESNSADFGPVSRIKNLTEYGSDRSGYSDRSEEFDDFPYAKYQKKAKVWNSQQMWYALERGYAPICEKGSPAERLMDRAKEILRQIIKTGMSDEEKIFAIYSWFTTDVQYDTSSGKYDASTDPENLPSQGVSKLSSHFAEGALFYGLSICIGHAKSCLLLLRIEGIEAVFHLARMPYQLGKNSIATPSVGFHGYVDIELDGKWYRLDPQHTASGPDSAYISYFSLCMPGKEYLGLYEVNRTDLEYGTDLRLYEKLEYRGIKLLVNGKEELDALLNAYFEGEDTAYSLSVFGTAAYPDFESDLRRYGAQHGRSYDVYQLFGPNQYFREFVIKSTGT